jgi:Ca-activated chloride channel family protein
VFLTVLGFGSGNLNDSMMEKITNKGNGNYFYIDRASEAKKVMAEQMTGTLVTVAKDVKIQVEFNPAKVASYRLIGYANRMLEREDFDDDTVDAGEIGAGHTVTALYEIVPVGVALDLTGGQDLEGLRYQRRLDEAADQDLEAKRQEQLAERGVEMVESNELLTVKLRYKQPDEDESALLQFPLVDPEDLAFGRRKLLNPSDDFHFASAVAAFGMRLRQSRYLDEDFGFDAIAEIAAAAIGKDRTGRRREFLDMIESAASLEPGAGDDVRRAVRERLEELR